MGTSAAWLRQLPMVRRPLVVILCLLLAACGGDVAPTAQPTVDTSAFLPLPPLVSGIPGPGVPTVMIEPVSPVGESTLGVEAGIDLGHCGLVSPLDFDGSLWDPVGAHDGRGAPLSEDNVGELINATRVAIVLADADSALLVTPRGAVLLLRRHSGPRAYGLCD
jgi:hypothetical protein